MLLENNALKSSGQIYRFNFISIRYRLLLALILLGLFPCLRGYSQGVTFPVREQSGNIFYGKDLLANPTSGQNPNVLTVANDKRSQMLASPAGFSSKVKYKSNNTLVKFGINYADTSLPAVPFVYKLVYKLEGSKALDNDALEPKSITDTLVISYNPDSLSTIQDLQIRVYPNYYNAKLTIINIYDITDTSVGATPVVLSFPLTSGPRNFFIDLSMQYQAYSKWPYAPADLGLSVTRTPNRATQSLKISWTPSNLTQYIDKVTPAQYELEWTYVDNYPADSGAAPLSASSLQYDFKNNATRIITDSSNYSIPLVYPKGYIVYRVRMVRVDSVQYKIPIYGVWSPSAASGTISGLSNAYEIDTAHTQDALNWNYTIHFAEGGKYKHVVSYFDGLLKNRQTITRFNSNPNQLLVTENIYDYEGRPAITTLPSVIDTNRFTYQKGVSISSVTNAPYAPTDFDRIPDTCPDNGVIIPPFTTGSFANRYYSVLNTDTGGMQKYVPQAKGYPFVHTQLTPGFSDRVDKMGGAGDKLQIGMGHETQNEYVNADQPDLNQLFGINAGYKSFYSKTVSTDPNGQLSMSVKDYEGKLMTTSLIGASVDTLHTALMFNDEIPPASKFKEDQLAHNPQLTVGYRRMYNGNFFLDFDASIQVKYEYIFKPFQVCPAPNYLGLMVAGSYDYTVTDKCGDEMLHKFNTLGSTGVTTDPNDKVATDSAIVALDKGKFTLDKTLSINTDDVYAAVDSFFAHKPNCAKTEEEFIKEEVEKAHFPCPDSLLDPCAQLAKTMMEELFPKDLTNNPGLASSLTTGKYGVFTRNGGASGHLITGMTPSIFDIRRFSDYDTGTFRYQYSCVSTALNSLLIHVYGNTYSMIGTLPADSFEFVYEHAQGSEKYAIARALLPLHPEYCRLQGCFVDTFETRLNSIPNAAVAIKYGLFSLDSIVAKDIQLRQRMLAPAINMVNIADSLKLMLSGYVRMDTFAAEMAFCLNDDSLVFGDARTIFHSKIVSLDFPSMPVRDVYFQKLRAFYINNRNKYRSIAQTGGGNQCLPCDTSARMHLKPPPLVLVTYNTDGSFNTGVGGMLSLFSGSLQSSLAAAVSTPVQIRDSATVAAYQDTATRGMHRIDSLLSYIAVDTVMGRLVNCISSPSVASLLKASLIGMVVSGEVHNGIFRPEQLRKAILAAGLTQSDLCHPYLYSYDYFDDGLGARGSCASGTFYNAVRDFLNDTLVLNKLRNATATASIASIPAAFWNSTNLFGDQVLGKLNGTTGNDINLLSRYDAARKLYHLSFFRLGSATTDTVHISLRSPVDITVGSSQYALLQPAPSGTSVYFSNVACYYEDPQAYAEGHIGRYEFRATVDRMDGSQNTRTEMLGWNNGSIYMNEAGGGNTIATCVPCTQFKAVYKAFADSMLLYGGYAADHPLFLKSLRSFMNYNLKKVFTQDQYERFLQSCALADSMLIPMRGGYARVSFGSQSAFNTFKQTIQNSYGFTVKPLINYAQGTQQKFIINYSNVPFSLIRAFNTQLLAAGAQINQSTAGLTGTLWVPASSPVSVSTLLSGTALVADNGTTVTATVANNPVTYTMYRITVPSGTGFAAKSTGIAAVRQQIYDRNIQCYWMPTNLSTVNKDYYSPEKTQLLSYTYGLESVPGMTPAKVLDTLQDYLLENNITAFAGSDVSYSDPANPYQFTNLYYTRPANTFPGYLKLKNILGYALGTLSSTIFLPANASNNTRQGLTNPGGSSLMLYRCSDGLYWYRYFDTDLKLYNVFVRMPSFVFRNAQPGYHLLNSTPGTSNIITSNGDSATRRFTLRLTNGVDTITADGSTNFDIAWSNKLSDVLLGTEDNYRQEDPLSGEPGAPDNCEQVLLANAIYSGKIRYINYIDSFRTHLKAAFYAHVMGQIREKLWIEYIDMRFATTLYNYDLAGNLIQTVPPEGVHRLGAVAAATVDGLRETNQVNPAAIPSHGKSTRYEYNTANKPLTETTPDAGQKTMYYDAKGNVIASQSARQRASGTFTYMLYDGQNRVTETGEVHWGSCAGFADQPMYTRSGSVLTLTTAPPCACANMRDSLWQYCITSLLEPYTTTYNDSAFAAVIIRMPRTQVVVSIYDSALFDLGTKQGMSSQENLRGRIAANLYYEACGSKQNYKTGYMHGTHYSYDVTGNVQTLVQDFPELEGMQQRYKRVDYEYDLLSGKVNMIAYNRGATDQFYQQYSYDADNRITKAATSHDGVIWKRDAEYTYYKHGPLARVSLGDQRVQGIDYAYTIQGWLKKINGDYADGLADMGSDGRGSAITPKDVYATSISYFDGDYSAIAPAANSDALPVPAKSLYNGNIARQTTDIAPFGALTSFYTYDQLNRLRKVGYARRYGDNELAFANLYASTYKYDQDGNIRALTRRDSAGQLFDNFSYSYPNSGSNNKLANVLDSSTINLAGVEDLKHYVTPGFSRMLYDADGNLVKDLTSGTDTVKWNIYGKTTDVLNTTSKLNLHFIYDGAGQRVSKNQTITSDSGHTNLNTYYVRDATGNILAEYNSRQVYKNSLLTPMVVDWVKDVSLSTDVLIDAVHVLGYDLNDVFTGTITSSAGTAVAHLPGYYLYNSTSLLQSFVSNNNAAILPALCRYSSATGHYPLGDAAMLAIEGGDETQLTTMSKALFTQSDEGLRDHIMTQLAISIPALYKQVASDNGIDSISGTTDSQQVAQIISSADPAYLSDLVGGYYQAGKDAPGTPNPILPWLQAITSDSLYYTSDGGLLGGDILSTLQANLVNYGVTGAQNEAKNNGNDSNYSGYGFYAFASDLQGSLAMVQAAAGDETLETVSYNSDPVAYLISLTASAGNDVLNHALDSMGSAVDASQLYYQIQQSAQKKHVPVGPPPIAQAEGPILQQQQISLGNHHIYGSSRLGIAGYWPVQYLRSWNYVSGISDTLRLRGGEPWYSYAYNDVIEAGKTAPWGNGLRDGAALARHLNGQKQYELANHLGNVQATVSDRRYVKGDGFGGRLFRPAIAAAYDYYPFGMLMPKRWVIDTGRHTATVSQTMLVPRVTQTGMALNGTPNSSYISVSTNSSGATASGQGGEVRFPVTAMPNIGSTALVTLSYAYSYTVVTVSEYVNGVWYQRGSSSTSFANTVRVPFLAGTGPLRVGVGTNVSYLTAPANGLFTVSSIKIEATSLVAQNVVTIISNGGVDKYEFGFNGKLKDNEIAGTNNHLDYGLRGYDTRTGKFWSIDPLTQKFPYWSPYQFSGLNPIRFNDLDGAEPNDPLSRWFMTDAAITLTTQPTSAKAKVYSAMIGVAGPVGNTVEGVLNIGIHPVETAKGMGRMMMQTPQQNAVDYAVNTMTQYADLPGDNFQTAVYAHIITDFTMAILPFRGSKLKAAAIPDNVVVMGSASRTATRMAFAESVFKKAGKVGDDVKNLMKTINFSKTVKETSLNVGDKIYRFERVGKPNSDMHFFTDAHGADAGPQGVGFEPSGYELNTYEVTKQTTVMESTIKETGQKQYFSTELQGNVKKTATE